MEQLPILWFCGALIAGIVGSHQQIGFWKAFLAALFLSFPIGIIITLVYKNKSKKVSKENGKVLMDSYLEHTAENEQEILLTPELQQIK